MRCFATHVSSRDLLRVLVVAALLWPSTPALAQRRVVTLESAAAVREQHGHGLPGPERAQIRGVITFLLPAPAVTFVQDGTGGVCVVGTRDREARAELRVGSEVEVSGMVIPGDRAPLINGAHRLHGGLQILGQAPLPPAKQVSIAQLARQENHGILVEVPAVVRTVQRPPTGPAVLHLTLAAGADLLEATLLQPRNTKLPADLIGAQVRVTGVFNSAYADRQQVFSQRLLVASLKDIAVLQAAAAPAEIPLTSLARAPSRANSLSVAPMGARVRVRGTVTLSLPERGFYLQSEAGAVAVEAAQDEAATVGAPVEVVGFVGRREGSLILEHAVWQEAPKVDAPTPVRITAEEAQSGAYDAHLVQMEGLLLESSRLDESPTLVLQSGTKVFLARFADSGKPRRLPSLDQNSWLRVTGICLNGQAPQLRMPADETLRRTFHLLLSGPAAVEVARAPNWWTLRRILLAFGALLLLAAAAFAWVIVLRRRVAQQTGVIRDHLARKTLYEERVRIARELHDSLEQDLVGIGMQLKATEKLLALPDRARSSLHLASAMVRRSQAETHRAVWDLREPLAEGTPLGTALHSTLSALAPEGGPAIQVSIQGEERILPVQTESHLLRIAAEAVTNARKHAAAERVEVAVHFEDDVVRLSITDDGCGFDPARLPTPSAGHFGLFGMHERVEKLGGRLHIHSDPGKGTRIEVVAPLNGAPAHLP